MTSTTTDTSTLEPISRAEARGLAEEEYRRWADALGRLGPDDWAKPTDCDGWTVRDMAGHVLGAMRAAASVREQMNQQREIGKRVKASGENQVDVMTALQIERTADLSAADITAETQRLVGPAAKGRAKTPALLRRFMTFDVEMGLIDETWTLGYLVDTILTRDILMHRIDLARAAGSVPDMTGAHARRLVGDIVREWGDRHERAFELELSGDGGGRFSRGASGERLELATVDFLRNLSGRGSDDGVYGHQVPF